MGGNMRSLCWREVVFLGCQTETSTIWGFSAMLPPCSLETVHVEVGEVLMMTCQSIEVTRWVKVLDKIDPYLLHYHSTNWNGSSWGSLLISKTHLNAKKSDIQKKKEPLPNNGFQAPLSSQVLTFRSFLASKNVEVVSMVATSLKARPVRYKIPHCRSQLSRAPRCAKAQQGRNCGGFFSRKVVGMGKHDKLWPVGWCEVALLY